LPLLDDFNCSTRIPSVNGIKCLEFVELATEIFILLLDDVRDIGRGSEDTREGYVVVGVVQPKEVYGEPNEYLDAIGDDSMGVIEVIGEDMIGVADILLLDFLEFN